MGDAFRRPTTPGYVQQQVFSFDGFGMHAEEIGSPGPPAPVQTSHWLVNLFPHVAAAGQAAPEQPSTWPADAIELSNSLVRINSLDSIHGLEIKSQATHRDPRWDRVTSFHSHVYLHSKDRWLNHATTPGATTNVEFCDADQRGVYSRTMLLGRVRKTAAADRATPNLPASDYSIQPIHKTYPNLNAKVEAAGQNRKRLVLSHVDYRLELLIDTQRNVILETAEHRHGELKNRVVFSDFKTVAGRAWASKLVSHRTLDDMPVPEPRDAAAQPELHITSETKFAFRELNDAAFGKRFESALSDKPQVQFLQLPVPSSADAREARTTGKAGFEDHVVLADYFHHSGQWDRVKEHLDAIETLAGDARPGMWFVRNTYLREMDRESMRVRIIERARQVVAKPSLDDFYLASFLVGQMQQITAYNEQLELLDLLKPVYDRQPEHVGAQQSWMTSRLTIMSGLGRNDLVIELRHKLAIEQPWDTQSQTQYAYALTTLRQDFDSAINWLQKVLKDNADKWTTSEDENLRNVISGFLENQGRHAELLTHAQAWAKRNPNSYQVHARLLTALVWNDKLDEADALILEWIKAGVAAVTDEEFDEIKSFQAPAEKLLPRDVTNRMTAALNMAMGQGYNLYTYRIDPKWFSALSKVVYTFARQRNQQDFANQVISHAHFANTNEGNLIRREAFGVLNDELATLPYRELQTMLRWSLASTDRIELAQWVDIADGLETRWEKAETDSDKNQIGGLLLQLLSARLDMERRLEFMRRQIKDGGEAYRENYIRSLFSLLLAQPAWKDEFEVEAFSWLPKLSKERTGKRMASILPALYRLSDQMISQRYQTVLKDVDQETKANRIAFRKKKYELYRAARAGYLKRLGEVMAEAEDWLSAWMKIEHVYLSIKQADDLKQQAKLVREFLGDAPPPRIVRKPWLKLAAALREQDVKDGLDRALEPAEIEAWEREELAAHNDQEIQDFFAGVLRYRYVLTAAHLATRRSTTKVIADALLKYVDAGIAMNPADRGAGLQPANNGKAADKKEADPQAVEALRIAAVKSARNMSWKMAKYRLLIALDRPRELERDLLIWIQGDRQTAPWRLSLARLLAEQGRLDEAVRLYKAVEHADELKPSEYQALADWYLALDKRDEYETAKFNFYATMPEGNVSSRLRQQLARYHATDGSAPATLDTDILLMTRVLLEKSSYPANHIHLVGSFYATTKDFRLFRSVPIAALGQTAGHTYSFVSGCQYAFSVVMEEATVDEIIELLRETRAAAKTTVDKRALDLLEVVAERQVVALQNQAGPHVKPALAALKRAFEHEWADGEHMMMMHFLSALGRIQPAELATEQRRQMKQLYDWSEAGSFDRLQMANIFANTLWNDAKQAEAFVLLEAAINEFDQANDKKWPAQANNILEGYFTKLQQKGRYAEAESMILDHLTRPRDKTQLLHFDNRLDRLYYDALANGGTVSLGTGEVLYAGYVARLLKRLESADDNLAYQLVTKVLDMLSHARGKKWGDANADFRSFAYTTIPELLKRSTNNYRNILNAVSKRLQEFVGATEAIRYLLDRIDADPPRFRYRNDEAWSYHAGSLAGWLYHIHYQEKKELPEDLAARLLKFALAELRRDLTSHQTRSRYIYGNEYGYLWKAKKPDFLRETEAILKERKGSGEAVTYIAAYLYQLTEYNRCIEIMFDAHRENLLKDNHIWTLVTYLQFKKRYGESVALLEGLIERNPNSLGYRTNLMSTYFKVDRKNQMMALLESTHDYFHKENRWTEGAMAQLAGATASCELWEQSAMYYSNAIMERRRTNPLTAAGDSTLSGYYSSQSNAYVKLGKTKEAVDAAASGIVSWGSNSTSRNYAVNVLVNVFAQVPDRDDYATFLDKEAERTQQDRAVVRKALGLAYQQKSEYAKAAAQLKLATELQPNDSATHIALISCYDYLKDESAAIEATFAFLQLDRRNVDTYAKLGERFKSDAAQQERALTGMVEMKPNESDSHTKLAEIRQRQNRWGEAIDHWQHVVRIRSLEPTGLQKLIGAQIHEKRFDDARRNVKKLEETKWPPRFGSMHSWVDRFRREIGAKR